jgi:hypothetical protein
MRANEFIIEGWWSNFKDKANITAKNLDFATAKRYIDWLINKAKSNNINGLDAVTGLGWYSIQESVAHTKDQKLDQLFNEIWVELQHWPKNNTDVQRSKHLIDQLTILRKSLNMFNDI